MYYIEMLAEGTPNKSRTLEYNQLLMLEIDPNKGTAALFVLKAWVAHHVYRKVMSL